jgi:hypothetical protein
MGSGTRTLSQQGNNWTYDFSAKAGVIASASEISNLALIMGKLVHSNLAVAGFGA